MNAKYDLALLYHYGGPVKKDYETAYKLSKDAAERGHSGAQTHLAILYANGQGVQSDLTKDYMWSSVSLASSSVDSEDKRRIGKNLKALKGDMTKEQIGKAKTLVAQCNKKNETFCP